MHRETSTTEARALRAAVGRPENLHPLYGAMGERDLVERQLAWLLDYEVSRSVRIGNAVADQH